MMCKRIQEASLSADGGLVDGMAAKLHMQEPAVLSSRLKHLHLGGRT